MLRRIIFLIIQARGLVLMASCGSDQTIITSTDNGKKLKVKAGEGIMVILDGNLSTGYT